MKKVIIPIFGLVLLVGGFLLGRVTAPVPQAEPVTNPASAPAPTPTEPEPQEPEIGEAIEAEPSVDEVEQPEPEVKIIYVTSFYADVVETEKRLLVQGRPNNSAQYREDHRFNLIYSDETEVSLNGQPATIDDIVVGDRICVDFSGPKQESSPIQLHGILRISIFRE